MLWMLATTNCGFLAGDPILGESAASGSSGPQTSSTSTTVTAEASSAPATAGTGELPPAESSGSGEDTELETPTCACPEGDPDARCLRFYNGCAHDVWAGASGTVEPADAFEGLDLLRPGECQAISVNEVIGGRAWGRTGCVDGLCASDGTQGRGTLIQFSLSAEGLDLYDLGLLDAFNLPLAMIPIGVEAPDLGENACQATSCAANLNEVCAEPLVRTDDAGEIAYCENPCRACSACPDCNDCAETESSSCAACGDLAPLCCTGNACETNEYTALWRSLCPDAMTYAGEGPTFVCRARPDYDIVYCP